MRTKANLILVLILAVAFMPASSWGETFTVTTTSDSDCSDNDCDLQSALDAAAANDEDDTLNLASGLYNSTSPYVYDTSKSNALIINGAGSALTEIDGNGTRRSLYLKAGGDIGIFKVRIIDGAVSDANGGGLYAWSTGGSVWVDDAHIYANEAARPSTGGTGGGAYIEAAFTATITNSSIEYNVAGYEGGGAYLTGQAVHVETNTFFNNDVESPWDVLGGGLSVFSGALITVKDNMFNANWVSGSPAKGGCFYSSGPAYQAFSLTDNVFLFCEASGTGSLGGGVYVFRVDAPVEISGNEFTGNESQGQAGGLYVQTYGSFADLVVRNNAFRQNAAAEGGAAILGSEMALFDFVNNAAVNNQAAQRPGGVKFNIQGNARIFNNIFWGNLNTTPEPDEASDVVLNDVNLWGVTAELKYNDIGVWNTVGTVTTSEAGLIDADPLLALNDYHIANSTSPVIDAGINNAPSIPSLDIDGDPRVLDGDGDTTATADMGADEYVASGIQVTDTQGSSNDHLIDYGTIAVGGTTSFTVTVENMGAGILEIDPIASPSSPFSIASDGCSNTSLNDGATCSFDVAFAPGTAGTYNDSVTINSNAPGGAVVVTLTGTSITAGVPDIAITNGVSTISEYDFERVLRNTSDQLKVYVKNEGTAPLEIKGVALVSGTPFNVDGDACSGESLGLDEECLVTVGFYPTEGNMDYTDELQVSSNDPDAEETPASLVLSGHTNHPPTAPELVRTFYETSTNRITFYWNQSTDSDGDPIEYGVFVCDEMDFSGCSEDPVCIGEPNELTGGGAASEGLGRFASATLVLMAFGLVVGGPRMRRGIVALLLVVLLIAGIASLVLLPGCGVVPEPGEYDFYCSVEPTSTDGYWRVRAWDVIDDARYDYTDSEVSEFYFQ